MKKVTTSWIRNKNQCVNESYDNSKFSTKNGSSQNIFTIRYSKNIMVFFWTLLSLLHNIFQFRHEIFSVTLMKLWINYYDISHQKNGKERLHDRNRLKGRRYEHMKKWSVMFWQTGCIKRTNKSIPLVNTSSPPFRMKTTEPKEIACNFYLR